MSEVKYLCSFRGGSYHVSCEILEELNNQYKIKFYDDFIGEYVVRWTTKDRLEFPELGDQSAKLFSA